MNISAEEIRDKYIEPYGFGDLINNDELQEWIDGFTFNDRYLVHDVWSKVSYLRKDYLRELISHKLSVVLEATKDKDLLLFSPIPKVRECSASILSDWMEDQLLESDLEKNEEVSCFGTRVYSGTSRSVTVSFDKADLVNESCYSRLYGAVGIFDDWSVMGRYMWRHGYEVLKSLLDNGGVLPGTSLFNMFGCMTAKGNENYIGLARDTGLSVSNLLSPLPILYVEDLFERSDREKLVVHSSRLCGRSTEEGVLVLSEISLPDTFFASLVTPFWSTHKSVILHPRSGDSWPR